MNPISARIPVHICEEFDSHSVTLKTHSFQNGLHCESEGVTTMNPISARISIALLTVNSLLFSSFALALLVKTILFQDV